MNHDGVDLPSRYFGGKQMKMIREISETLITVNEIQNGGLRKRTTRHYLYTHIWRNCRSPTRVPSAIIKFERTTLAQH